MAALRSALSLILKSLVRQGEEERRPFVRLAFRPYATSVAIDNALDIGQSDPVSFKIFLCVETLEHTKELGGKSHIETHTVIPNENNRLFSGFCRGANLDRSRVARTSVL